MIKWKLLTLFLNAVEITKYFNLVYNFIPKGTLQAKNYDPNIVSRGQL